MTHFYKYKYREISLNQLTSPATFINKDSIEREYFFSAVRLSTQLCNEYGNSKYWV